MSAEIGFGYLKEKKLKGHLRGDRKQYIMSTKKDMLTTEDALGCRMEKRGTQVKREKRRVEEKEVLDVRLSEHGIVEQEQISNCNPSGLSGHIHIVHSGGLLNEA